MAKMTDDEALNIVEEILEIKQLNNVQKIVFCQAWEGQSYMQIANAFDYDYSYIKDIGSQLWQMLSTALRQKVTKLNFQSVLKHYAKHRESQFASQSAFSRPEVEPLESSLSPNYSTLSIDEDETRWVGRESLVDALTEKIKGISRVLMLVGITGIGKSSLAIRLSLEPAIAQTWPFVHVIRFDAEQQTFEQFARLLLKEQMRSDFELEHESQKLVIDLVNYLQTHPSLLLLDMVEEILETGDRGEFHYKDPLFAQFFDRFIQVEPMPSRLILTSQDRLPVIAEGRYLERSHLEYLKGLNPEEALELFGSWEVYPQTDEEREYLQRIVRVYEGHPLALRVIAGEIRESPYNRDIQAYWHDYGEEIVTIEQQQIASDLRSSADSVTLANYSINLTDLVKCRIERTFIRLRVSSPLAYILLCMGATYRCSVERTAWLLLIAECPKEAQIIAFQTLQRRFLLETDSKAGRVFYRLHSLIRSIALQHLVNFKPEILL
ncbi:NB-ARC domain-containing protein [Microcoleus sp. CAWBG640]|uniref:NB-ARC domain-containing protein n=1 Tax=Microcoleus sp. CAWBG640 TaxID=2841653 RepID=UPI00312BA434